ncbi:diguanylate cyclase [Candidatus Omnitrophota bacterium]
MICLQIALNWRNQELKKALRRLDQNTLLDPLTGLHNYRYFCRRLKQSLLQAKRNHFPLSLIKIDIELFKNVNKIYGSLRGDDIMIEFAQFLSLNIRKGDVLSRIEDDEFIVISNYVDKAEALFLADRLQQDLALHYFGKEKINLRISLGLVTYPDNATSEETLLTLLDQCVEYSKENNNKITTLEDLKRRSERSPADGQSAPQVQNLKNKISGLKTALRRTTLETIIAFANTIKAKDLYTAEHTERTVTIAVVIANELSLDASQIEVIKYAAMLHDLGKVGIPESILQKPAALNAQELEQIQKHPVIGAEILRPLHPLRHLISAILYHHERVDGKGYPYGLTDEQIPIEAKVVAIADSFQALTSDRPYRKAYEVEDAIEIIKDEAGTHFDNQIVKALLRTLQT